MHFVAVGRARGVESGVARKFSASGLGCRNIIIRSSHDVGEQTLLHALYAHHFFLFLFFVFLFYFILFIYFFKKSIKPTFGSTVAEEGQAYEQYAGRSELSTVSIYLTSR